MFCENCGKELNENASFCDNCGAAVSGGVPEENNVNRNAVSWENTNHGMANKNDGKNSGLVIALIILLSVFIFVIVFFIGMNIYDSNQKKSASSIPLQTVTPTQAPSATPITVIVDNGAQPPQPPAQVAPPNTRYEPTDRSTIGVMRYDSSRTYKRMGSIHNTVATDTNMWYKLRDFIETFDSSCESYMNYGDSTIFNYLRSGTTGYEQQTQYKAKHPNLTQYYTDIQVLDTRVGGGYYYVWVQETLSVTENGSTKTENSNWVYKIGEDSRGFFVNDYTKDPAV